MLKRKKKGKNIQPQEPNNNQIQNSNNILSKIGGNIINKIPNLKVPPININHYLQLSSFINGNSASKGYRSFLDGFNRNIIGNNKYSDYNTEFIEPYFPQDIIDSLTIKEGKYDIIGIFNGECLVYNKHDKKVESHNCELTNKKMKELEAAAKIQEMDRRIMTSNQMQRPMIEAAQERQMVEDAPQQQMIEDAPQQQMIEAAPQQQMIEAAPPQQMIEAGPEEQTTHAPQQLMIEAAPPQPIPMLSPSPQILSQFNGLLPQIKFPTTNSLLPDKPSQNDYEPTLLIENNQPPASQPQEQQQQNMNTGSEESKQTNTNTDSEIVDVMKQYTTGNINKNINKDILNLGKNNINPVCRANNFITYGLCEYGEDGKSKLGKKNGLYFHPSKNMKCPNYGENRLEMLHNFCDNKEIPDEYKDPTVYKKKYDNALKVDVSQDKSSNNAEKSAQPKATPSAKEETAQPKATPSAKEETTQPKQTSTKTKPLLITNGPQTPETKHLAITNGQQSNVVNRFGNRLRNAANKLGNAANRFGNAANTLGNTVINLGNAAKRGEKSEVLRLTNKSSTTSDEVAPTSQTVTTTSEPKQAWVGKSEDEKKQEEIKQANAIKNKINVTKPNKINFRTIKGYFSAIKNNIDEFEQLKNDESKKIITDHIVKLITKDFDKLINTKIENDADKEIRKKTKTELGSLNTKLRRLDISTFITIIDTKIAEYDDAKAKAEEEARNNSEPESESTVDNPGRNDNTQDDGDETYFGDLFGQSEGGKKANKTKKLKKSKKKHQNKQGRKTRKNRS